MEIRAVREAEVEQMIELMCLVFRPNGHERYRQYMVGDPTLPTRSIRASSSTMGASLRPCGCGTSGCGSGSSPLRMGGIGNVCTHPEARGKGYATLMMEDAVRYMTEAGYPISCLFSDVGNRFYHRFGVPECTVSWIPHEPVEILG